MVIDAGTVVLVPFPYRDQLAERTRPAVVLSTPAFNQQGDLIVAAVISHAPRFPSDYPLIDWKSAGFQSGSTVRMLLATVATTRVKKTIGNLSSRDWAEVQKRVFQVFT